MKKQIKQKQDDTQAKQNPNRNSDASANENRTPVSDETKQKLVKQYADRAEKESSKQNPVDWGYFNSPKFGSPVDERKQIANSAEASPSRDLPYGARWGDFDLPKNSVNSDGGFPDEKHLASNQNIPERRPSLLGGNGNPIDFVSQQPEALTHAIYDDYGFLSSPRAEYSSGGRNAIQNAQYYDSLGDYNRFFTQDALNNEMSGPDANAIYYANGMTVPERNLINQIANLAYNKVENERIDQQDYQKALIAQMLLQPQLPQRVSPLGVTEDRPLPRQRNITGSAVW